MKSEQIIKYNVKTIVETNINDELKLKREFNKKLLKIIYSLEENSSFICQT